MRILVSPVLTEGSLNVAALMQGEALVTQETHGPCSRGLAVLLREAERRVEWTTRQSLFSN